ncbi:MAG: hypothetical protein OIN88_00985 [Candidatus Methanoperedens sp.]|nr:hypothetical protein [Candidatus Methanoperedens sp.]
MNRYLTILTGFIHDFAAGLWVSTVLVVYLLNRQAIKSPELADALLPLKTDFFYIGLVCIAVVLFTGMGRTFTYIGNVYGENAEMLRKRMLIAKHILLFVIFGSGTYWQYTMVF